MGRSCQLQRGSGGRVRGSHSNGLRNYRVVNKTGLLAERPFESKSEREHPHLGIGIPGEVFVCRAVSFIVFFVRTVAGTERVTLESKIVCWRTCVKGTGKTVEK